MDVKTEVSNIAKVRCQDVALQLIHMRRHCYEKSHNVTAVTQIDQGLVQLSFPVRKLHYFFTGLRSISC